MLRRLISRTNASVMMSRESIFSCIRTSVIFSGCSGIRRLSVEATKCSQLIPTSSTVSASSSSVRFAVFASLVKFSISVKCFILISRGVSPVGLESGKSEICGAPVCWSTNLKTLDSFSGLDCRMVVPADSTPVHDSLPLVCDAILILPAIGGARILLICSPCIDSRVLANGEKRSNCSRNLWIRKPGIDHSELQHRVILNRIFPPPLRDVADQAGIGIEYHRGSQFDDGQGQEGQVLLRLRTLRPSSSE